MKRIKLSIRNKFYIILLLVLLSIVIIPLGIYIETAEMLQYRDYNVLLSETSTQYLNLLKDEEYFFLSYETDEQFFAKGNTDYINRFQNQATKLDETLDELAKHQVTTKLKLDDELSGLRQQLTLYRATFNRLKERLRELGYAEAGLISQVNISYEAVKEMTDRLTLINTLEEMRQNEKNFMLYNDKKYYERFIKSYNHAVEIIETQESIPEYLPQPYIPPANDTINTGFVPNTIPSIEEMTDTAFAYDNLLDASLTVPDESSVDPNNTATTVENTTLTNLNDYKNTFERLVAMYEEIGMTPNEGLTGQLITNANNFEADFDTLRLTFHSSEKGKLDVSFIISVVLVVVLAVVLIIIILYFLRNIRNPLYELSDYMKKLSNGILPEEKLHLTNSNDEFLQLEKSINKLTGGLQNISHFITALEQNKFDMKFEPLSKNDALGNAVLQMRNTFQTAKNEEENRKKEDEKRSWSNHGLTKFTDIMRQNTDDITELAYKIISELVKYTKANQGGLYLYNDDDKDDIHLELLASYAYDRRRFITQKINIGEGLVGTCALERKVSYLDTIPQDYIKITSGLGDANPGYLLLVPMIREDTLMGVIEIASFHEFENHVIEFIIKIAENVASTMASAKNNRRTAQLLKKSKEQAEAMASQEEELRQNLEELEATREEAARKEEEATGFIDAVSETFLRADINLEGIITFANPLLIQISGYTYKELIGKHINMLFREEERRSFSKQWANLARGDKHIAKPINHLTKNKTVWLYSTFTPVRNRLGDPTNILFLAYNIHQFKKMENELKLKNSELEVTQQEFEDNLQKTGKLQEEYQQSKRDNKDQIDRLINENLQISKQLEKLQNTNQYLHDAVNSVFAIARYKPDDQNGKIIDVNNQFLKDFELLREQLLEMHHRDLIPVEQINSDTYKAMWKKILRGESVTNEQRYIISGYKEVWKKDIFSPVKDQKNKVIEVYQISVDITGYK